jgi:hypothetical protein
MLQLRVPMSLPDDCLILLATRGLCALSWAVSTLLDVLLVQLRR